MVLIAAVTTPQEGLVYFADNIELKIGAKVIGNGKLYLSQNALEWQGDNMPNGISIHWKEIAVHGVSADPVKCIYFMLDHKLVWRGVYEDANDNAHNGQNDQNGAVNMEDENAENNVNDAVEEDEAIEDEEHEITECWITPSDSNVVDTIFLSMADLQALHRDSDDSISDADENMVDDMEGDEDNDDDDSGYELGGSNSHDNGADNARNGMQNLNLNDEQFEDAEE